MTTYPITLVYFSPSGGSQKIAQLFGKSISPNYSEINLLTTSIQEPHVFAPEELVVFVMPTHGGRLPSACPDILKKSKGQKTPAVAMVAYGNRAYEDALLELFDILKKNEFETIGAGAFIARHAIFPKVADGRPNEEDGQEIARFAQLCVEKLQKPIGERGIKQQIRGYRPYTPLPVLPLKPFADENCTLCGECAEICPTGAIPKDAPNETDENLCITCTACIYICPEKARGFPKEMFTIGEQKFREQYSEPKTPEFFL